MFCVCGILFSERATELSLLILQQSRVHLLDTEKFDDTFGPKKKRRRPKLAVDDYETLVEKVNGVQGMTLCRVSSSRNFSVCDHDEPLHLGFHELLGAEDTSA